MKKRFFNKRMWLALLVASVAFAVGESFAENNNVRVTLSVKDSQDRSDNRVETVKENSEGTEITTTTDTETETCTLTVKIKSRSDVQTLVQLEWYFLSEEAASEELVVHEAGKKEISLVAGLAELDEMITSKPMEFKRVSSSSGDSQDKYSGDTYKGYVLLVTRGDAILAKDSNSTRYLKDRLIEQFRKQAD